MFQPAGPSVTTPRGERFGESHTGPHPHSVTHDGGHLTRTNRTPTLLVSPTAPKRATHRRASYPRTLRQASLNRRKVVRLRVECDAASPEDPTVTTAYRKFGSATPSRSALPEVQARNDSQPYTQHDHQHCNIDHHDLPSGNRVGSVSPNAR